MSTYSIPNPNERPPVAVPNSELGKFAHLDRRTEPMRTQRQTRDEPTSETLAKKPELMDLISAHQGMFFTCRYDGVWTMEYVSEGCTSLTGYQPIDLIHNQQVSYGQLIDPADREGIVNGLKALVLAGQRYDQVYRIRTRDGQEKWVRESGRCKMLTENSVFFTEGLVTDITDLKRSQERIQRQAMRLEALHKIDIAIMSSFDLRITLDLVLEQATTHLGLDASYILLFDPLTQTLEYTAWHGPCASPWRSKKMRIGEGLAGKTALERRPLCIDDLQSELNDPAFASSTGISSFVTYCSVPLIAKGQLKGVLEGFHRQPIQRDDDWANYLDALASQAAIAIDNISMFDELQRSNAELSLAYDATLEGWSKALELRDRETEGHTQRVTQMTLRLGRAVGMTPSELISVYRGALLHDIGKMGIPDQILLKAGPLDAEEWDVMRQHPLLAYQLLSTIPSLRPALDIPYCHHEKWDGSGYPRGLKGDQIPLPARIFAVVDVWDALTTDRPYRAAWSAERAIEYIREQSGSHFDPQVVEVFLLLYDSGQMVRYDGIKKAKAKATLLSM